MPLATMPPKQFSPEKSPGRAPRATPKSKFAAGLAAAVCLLAIAGILATRHQVPSSPAAGPESVAGPGRAPVESAAGAAGADAAADAETRRRVGDVYGQLPMSFEANEGQTDPRVKFLSRGDGYGLFLTSEEFVLLLRGDAKEAGRASGSAPAAAETAKITMRLEGAKVGAPASGMKELPGRVNYLTGRDERKWRRAVPSFAAVRYEGVYAGVDLIFYGNQRQLEYDFVVAAGADPASIRMRFGGGDRLEVDAAGELVIHTKAGEVRQRRPFVYQEVAGARREVAGAYRLEDGGRVGFRIGEYDPSLPLTIDPVLVYSTHLGGKHMESLNGLAVDSAGHAYVTGGTYSVDFPATAGAFQTTTVGAGSNFARQDAFVTKFNVVGNAVVYSTFLGGNSANEIGMTVAVDSGGHAYVSGVTFSATDFPVTPGAPQPAWGGGTGSEMTDGFVSKLNPAGSALVYSTYLGGDGVDDASDLVVDAEGNAYVAGTTFSTNFPVTPGAYRATRGPTLMSFVTKLNAAGSAFAYSTLVGGGQQGGQAGRPTGPYIAVDPSGVAHLAGLTYNADYPVTPGALQPAKGLLEEDAYYTKLAADGRSLAYSTFLGGRREDSASGIALDASGNAYVVGTTDSSDFHVTAGAFDTTYDGSFLTNAAGFVTKFSPSAQVIYSTYFGSPSSPHESIADVAVNAAGEAWIVGNTSSASFPVTDDAYRPTANAIDDNFLSRLSADGASLLYSTRFGGTQYDGVNRVALDAAGGVYIAGSTASTDLPVTPGSFQTALGPTNGLFVTKFGAAPLTGHSIGGRVTDGTNPIAGVMIRLGGTLEGTQWSRADGTYSFGSVPAGGNYTVTPWSPLYDFGTQSQTINNLSGDETADFVATVRRFRIAGRARDTNGVVLGGVSVTLSIGGVNSASVQTDADGRYGFDDLPAVGAYEVRPFKANYTFTPSSRRFENLTADVAGADFAGRLSYRVGGRLADSSGAPITGIRVDLDWSTNGAAFRATTQTNSLGNYSFINLTPGGTYTVTPSSFAYSFAPASQTFSNVAANHTADFTGTLVVATISGRVVDEGGRGVQGVTVRVSGGATSQGFTDFNGNYSVGGLRKGQSYTLSPVLLGYSFTPASKVVELSGNTTADFAARLLTPRPFTPGNILVSANHVLTEYTPEGAQVQAVIVPQPLPTPVGSQPHQTGDVVLDKNGDALIVNSRPLALASFSQPRQSWQNVTLNASTNFHELGGLAAVGDYAFAPSVDDSNQGSRRGLVRLNMNDNSVAHFQTVTGPGSYQDLTAGLDGLLYALSYTVSNDYARLHVLDPQTLQLVRERLMGFNTLAVTANSAGDVFYGTRHGALVRSKADGTVIKQVSLGGQQFQVWDIDVSADGRIVVSVPEKVIVLDEDLNVLSSFTPRNGQGYTGFTKPAAVATVQLAAATFEAGEGAGQATVAVTRAGDLSGPASVEFSTTDDPAAVRCDVANAAAYARCDYATTVDTVRFAPGEAQKTIAVPLINDAHVEGAETVQLKLRRPSGALLGPQGTAVLTIADDDTSAAPNPVSHNSFFVRQHYLDFLSREPEQGEPWTGVLDRCPNVHNDPTCDRVLVSGAFFQSPEFRLKGLYTFLFYKAAFGRLPEYTEIIPDMRSVSGQTGDEVFEKRSAFAESFTQRPEFKSLYGDMTNQQYVDALLGRYNLQQITTEDTAAPEGMVQVTLTKLQLTNALANNSLTRAQVLRAVVQSNEADVAEYHGAFVAMQYYGYLRRTPEPSGYEAWLRVIRQDPSDVRVMIDGFMNSQEYRLRFGQP